MGHLINFSSFFSTVFFFFFFFFFFVPLLLSWGGGGGGGGLILIYFFFLLLKRTFLFSHSFHTFFLSSAGSRGIYFTFYFVCFFFKCVCTTVTFISKIFLYSVFDKYEVWSALGFFISSYFFLSLRCLSTRG